MSLASATSPSSQEPASRWKRTRRQTRAGAALVARGEPLVWLTGGALAICTLMIVLLLAIILINGAATFWPQPLVRVQLLDGSFILGPITDEEEFTLTRAAIDKLSEGSARAALAELGEGDELAAGRRLFRTGNYDLTETHFTWVNDIDIRPESESRPRWAIDVERTSWGRFYGEPKQFILKTPRVPSGEEQELQQQLDFFERPDVSLTQEQQTAIAAPLEKLRQDLQSIRAKSVAQFIEHQAAQTAKDARLVILSAEGQFDKAAPAGTNVTEVQLVWTGAAAVWSQFLKYHAEVRARFDEYRRLAKHDIGAINRELEDARLNVRSAQIRFGMDHLEERAKQAVGLQSQLDVIGRERQKLEAELKRFRRRAGADSPLTTIAAEAVRSLDEGLMQQEQPLREELTGLEREFAAMPQAVQETLKSHRAVDVNAAARTAEVLAKLEAIKAENARYVLQMETAQSQTKDVALDEIVRAFPANQLSLLQKAGIYLSRWWEFLSDEPREANSEGGVFPAIWGTIAMTLIMTLAVVPFGVLSALYLREYAKAGVMVSAIRISVNNLAGVPSIVYGVFGLGFFCYIIGSSVDQLFFEAKLPDPTFGKGGLMWASLTLALMTLPVVIVATEEALSAVPNSMREGSYACGASKWQTIRRIVLPRALPGMMTGAILAMARGAGEVAPLMLVGAKKIASDLPVDSVFPFIHADRSFMHLGFHIYDVGLQSQNSEAAIPMVFTTTLLLIVIVAALNLVAIYLRSRLRKRFQASQF